MSCVANQAGLGASLPLTCGRIIIVRQQMHRFWDVTPANQLYGSSFRLKIAKIAQNSKGTTIFNRSSG